MMSLVFLRLLRFVCLAGLLAASAWPQQDSRPAFHIAPAKPLAELRREALAAHPPQPKATRRSALAELIKLDPAIRLDIRYATANNFLGSAFYDSARAFLQRPAAEALVCVNRSLHALGYGLIIYDAYRPWYVTKMFWDATSGTASEKRAYLADPKRGSNHNRGSAVDVGLYRLKSGKAVVMPSGYDEMTTRAYAAYRGGTGEQRRMRDLLRRAMEAQLFRAYRYEWWHFDYRHADEYPIMNVSFHEIAAAD
jgi:D-alanyl-D-alanine dipeptidase